MQSAPLVDSHCHLADPRYDADRDSAIERAVAGGVRAIVCVGATGPMITNEATLTLVRDASPQIVAVVGIHPHDTAKATESDYAELRTLCASHHVVAVGETGLDYHYDHSPRDVQRAHFRRAIGLAREVRRPLVVHSREAFSDTATILREERAGELGGMIHCFTDGPDEARAYLDLGFLVSVSGIVTFKNADDVRAATRIVPEDRLLIETDGPYLAPVPYRGQRNEPAHVRHVAETVAEVRGVTLETVARTTTANASRLFGLLVTDSTTGTHSTSY
jgi:TatD DNase family protein